MWSPFHGLLASKLRVYRVDSDTGQPIDASVQAAPLPNVYTDIKKDKNGKVLMFRHQSRLDSVFRGDEKEPCHQRKRGNTAQAEVIQNNSGQAEKGGADFTADEDAKLRELKEGQTTWAQIAKQMSRAKHELQTRWKEIQNQPGAGTAGEKGDQPAGGVANHKGASNGQQGGEDFTEAEIEKMKELLATQTGYRKIAKELGRANDKHLKEQLDKLKAETTGGKGNDAELANAGSDAKDDEKIKELLQSGKNFKDIAEALGRPLDDPLKAKIGELKAMSGDGKNQKSGHKDKTTKKEKGGKDGGGGGRKEKPKDRVKADEPVRKARSVASHTRSHRSEARFTMQEWRALQEDEIFDLGELQLLSELIVKYGDQSWLNIASRFHDKTGRRVHPDDILDKFTQMNQMGKR